MDKDERLANIWRRIFALSIDLALLEVLGLILGWIFWDFFASLGRWGHLIGFSLAVLYFGVFTSQWGNGQTPGKRIARIQAIAQTGQPLPLSRSLMRAGILCSMILPFSKLFDGFPISLLIDFFTSIAILITVYAIVFNSQNKQGFHDLIVGSYVVRTKSRIPSNLPIITRQSFQRSLGFSIVIALGITSFFYNTHRLFPNLLSPNERISIQQEIKAKYKEIRSVNFNVYSYSVNRQPQTKVLQIKLDFKQKSNDLSTLKDNVSNLVFRRYPNIQDFDTIGLTTYYGYNIGLALGYQRQSDRYCPSAGKLKSDRQFPRHLLLKTLAFFESDWNLEKSHLVFIKFPFFTYGSNPSSALSLARTANSIGSCHLDPE
ncbi:MAG: RDD family protein [Cyanobacteria bacterium SBLK]|nr:RDD family protein [Cyanobacteria bacterium SBLK]